MTSIRTLLLGSALSGLLSTSYVQAQTQPFAPPVFGERILDLPLGDGLHQRVLIDAPPHPRGSIVMLPGGSGDVGIRRDGDLRHDDNFVVRTRTEWAARGYAVIIPDTIDKANLRGLRSSPVYARLVTALAAFARTAAPGPVFLLGTSQGSIAAMNGAAHAPAGQIAGVILTESVSIMGHSGETVFDADPEGVRVPALVMANRKDDCDVAPPAMAPKIAAAMLKSPNVSIVYVDGGVSRSENACGSLSPHGYYGIEPQVIATIGGWMQRHGG